MTYREEYVSDLKTVLERCNARIQGCAERAKGADAEAVERCRTEMRALKQRRRDALTRLRQLAES